MTPILGIIKISQIPRLRCELEVPYPGFSGNRRKERESYGYLRLNKGTLEGWQRVFFYPSIREVG
jgi:hypothetical protein